MTTAASTEDKRKNRISCHWVCVRIQSSRKRLIRTEHIPQWLLRIRNRGIIPKRHGSAETRCRQNETIYEGHDPNLLSGNSYEAVQNLAYRCILAFDSDRWLIWAGCQAAQDSANLLR